jgi:hypothetical protein
MNNNYLSIAALAAVFVCSTANAQVVNTPMSVVSGKVTAVAGVAVTINGNPWKIPQVSGFVQKPYTINGVRSAGPVQVGDTCSWTGTKTDTPATTFMGRPVPASVTYSVPVNKDGSSSVVCTR